MSVRSIHFEPSLGSGGYVDRIEGGESNLGGESVVFCKGVLYATLCRKPGRCREMQRSSIVCFLICFWYSFLLEVEETPRL
jgi:hypothetical protein